MIFLFFVSVCRICVQQLRGLSLFVFVCIIGVLRVFAFVCQIYVPVFVCECPWCVSWVSDTRLTYIRVFRIQQ